MSAPSAILSIPSDLDGKGSACSTGGLGRYPAEGKGYSVQYSCLENSMDRAA